MKVKENGEEWRQIVQDAKAHPELQRRGKEGRKELPTIKTFIKIIILLTLLNN
jgi:hypothetical protein